MVEGEVQFIMKDLDLFEELTEEHLYNDIFQERIRYYNDNEEYYNHFVELDNDKVMVIEWKKQRWSYRIEKLEIYKRRDENE